MTTLLAPINRVGRILTRIGLHRPALAITANDFWWNGEPEVRLLPWLVDPNKSAVDIGAANGVYSRHLMRLAKSLVAFEPNPISFSTLRKAVPSLDVRQTALSNKSGTVMLRVPVSGHVVASGWGTIHQGNNFSEISPDSMKNYTVDMAPLDMFDLDDVGFIKIDVEGHENEVLEGAREILEQHRPNILVEVSGNSRGNHPGKTCQILQGHGYTTMYLKDGKFLQAISQVPSDIDAINLIGIPVAA